MRGVSHDKQRDRWRCFHVSGSKIFQPRFSTEREAFWKKIELCAEDGVFPYLKCVKEGSKKCKSSKNIVSNLPVGIREYFSRNKNCWRVIANMPNGVNGKESTKEYRYKDGDHKGREHIIRQAAWERYEHSKERLLKDSEQFSPVNKDLLQHFFEKTEVALQTELNRCFNRFNFDNDNI